MLKPKMEARHFEVIAAIIRTIPHEDIRATTCLRFAGELQATNPKFDWDRFVKACNANPCLVEVAKAVEE